MFLKKLELSHFRNFEKFKQEFSSQKVLILGKNGSGKSNLLEAINFLVWGTSQRAQKDEQVIAWSEKETLVRAKIENPNQVNHQPSILINSDKKIFKIDGKTKNLLDFSNHFLAVLFSPSDLSLLEGSPRRRRRFLDQSLSLMDKKYLGELTNFKKILKNRNALLQKEKVITFELEYWSELFASSAAQVFIKRANLLRFLNEIFQKNTENLSLKYLPSPRSFLEDFKEGEEPLCVKQKLIEKLAGLQNQELNLGFSLIGPQRDDFKLMLTTKENFDLGVFGSRGEQRMAIIKLKKAQLQLLEEEIGEKAVFLLDDVFSELDQDNQKEILKLLEERQTFVTSTTKPSIFQELKDYQEIRLD